MASALMHERSGTAAPIESSGLQGLALCGPGSFARVKKETVRKKTGHGYTTHSHPPSTTSLSNRSQMWTNQSIGGHRLCARYTLHTSQTGHDAFKGMISAAR